MASRDQDEGGNRPGGGGLKRWFSRVAAGAAAEAGAEATRRGLKKLEGETPAEREAREAKGRKRKALLILGGGAVGLVLVLALMSKVLEWVLLAGFLGAVGYGGWLLLRPTLKRLGASRAEARRAREAKEAKRLEASRAKSAAEAAEAAKQARQQALEDELAALKARSGRDD